MYQRAYTWLYNANARRVEKYTWRSSRQCVQEWIRCEWRNRAKLPYAKANEACGVKEAAARKYMRLDKQRYFPPPDMMHKMAMYADQHGESSAVPYFSLDGTSPLTPHQWEKQRFPWVSSEGTSNMWPDFSIERITQAVQAETVWMFPNETTIPPTLPNVSQETKESDDNGQEGEWALARGNVEEAYTLWPDPDLIICDGPAGLGKYNGQETVDPLPALYDFHAGVWASRSKSTTRLCFWSTERAWATVHPTLKQRRWYLERIVVWDKGLSRVTKNWIRKNARMFPIVTEVCAVYTRTAPTGPICIDYWKYPRVHGSVKTTHPNQKQRMCMQRLIRAYTVPGNVVWEPFGGSATAAVVASEHGRNAYVAECVERYADLAEARLKGEPLPKQPPRRKRKKRNREIPLSSLPRDDARPAPEFTPSTAVPSNE